MILILSKNNKAKTLKAFGEMAQVINEEIIKLIERARFD